MDTIGDKLRKTANEFADRLGDAAHSAGERIAEMREIQRINTQIRERKRERDRCKITIADLLIRMFDQNTFAEALLRPEYLRIKELDTELATLEEERRQVTAAAAQPAPAEPEPEPEEMITLPETPEAPANTEGLPPDITAQE